MFALPSFRVMETIGSNEEISIYRVLRLEDNLSLIAKTTTDEYAGTGLLTAFEYEFTQLQRLDGKGVLEPYSLEIVADRPYLLMRDPGGTTLDQVLQTRRATLKFEDVLNIAIAVVDCIRLIHHAHITLHEIAPLFLILSEDMTEVKCIDLRSCSTELGQQCPGSLSAGRTDSILPYLSPEQTGRTGMVPDYRSDLYALGVILYEWFARSLPFVSQNALDLVYHHLASSPEPVSVKNQGIPRIVSDIVSKCMEKMPDARYESAKGIKADLEECCAQLRVTGKIQPFTLANHDVTGRWISSDKFYGRRTEQQHLLHSLQRVSEGITEIVWVTGEAGIGKTYLVMETLQRSVSAKVFFATGRCEFSTSAHPYHIWVQIIEQWIDQLSTVNLEQMNVWIGKILIALQGYGQLLIDRVPRMELLIGEQPAIKAMSPIEEQNQLHLIMNRFFQVFFDHGYTFVLFLDDLQWVDGQSLQYLYRLLEDGETKRLLIAGAYRDHDVHSQQPLPQLIKQLEQLGMEMEWIRLAAFDREDLKQILNPTQDGQVDTIDDLVDVVFHKTEGNPLFLKQFLQDVMDHSLVAFDQRSRVWQWDTQRIAELNVPETAAGAISNSLMSLSNETAYLLGKAALLGKQFELDLLSMLTGYTIEQISEQLEEAIDNRLLHRVHGDRTTYRFQHDDIQQSAYALVTEPERKKLHMEIGFILGQRLRAGEDIPIFKVMDHLDQAEEQDVVQGRKLQLAELNLRAGLEAKQSKDFETSLSYFRRVTDLLDEQCWTHSYMLTYEAYKERAEAEFLCAHFAAANHTFDLLLSKATTDLDKAQVCIMMIQLEVNRESYHKVIELGEISLKLLGVPYNFSPSSLELLLLWTRMRWRLRKYPVQLFSELPQMTDERHKAAMSVLVHTSTASFALNKNGWISSIVKMIEMTMDYGLTPEASTGFAGYAIVLNYKFHQYEAAYKWGKLACETAKTEPRLYAKVYTSFSLCFESWSRYEPGFLLKLGDHVGKESLQSGDLWHANHSMLINCSLLFQFSHPLKDIYDRLFSHSAQFRREDNSLLWKQAAILVELISTLTGHRASNDPFIGTDIHAPSFVEEESMDKEQFLQDLINVHQYTTGYILGNYKKAQIALEHSVTHIRSCVSHLLDPSSHYYYYVLVLKERYESGDKREKADCLHKIRHCAKKLKTLAERSPKNNLHKYLLAKAEVARLTSKYREAEQLYEQALDVARTNGYIHDAGIIAECFANYGIRNKKLLIAKVYMNEAYESYLSWGALAKTEDMEKKVGYLLHPKRSVESELERIDYLSVAMSAQALSGEMEMDKLLDILMRIMLQNAGAEYGALIFGYEDRWMVEVHGTADKLCIEAIPLEAAEKLIPIAIVGYTARMREEVVLHDAASNSMFNRDEYVLNNKLKSVLSLPIMHQNKLICLIYMENNLSTGVFTKERLDVLKLLSSQCAISITNAKLFSGIQFLKNNLEEQIEERTRTLERSMNATSEALAETTVYAERNRIAQEIHDIVGHTLTSTVLQIEAGKRLMKKDINSAEIRLKEAQDLVRHSLREIRNSVHMLKQDKYYDIVKELQTLINETEWNTGVAIEASIDEISHLSLIHKKLIYHALQEGLTNGIRHGNSTKFKFNITVDESFIMFNLVDNGIGISQIAMGFGLMMMKDRAEQLKGTLYIDSAPNKGCLLQIKLPNS